MKAMKHLPYNTFILIFLAVLSNIYAQDKKVQETFKWKYEVNEDVRFTFNNYNCDLIIHTTDKNEIEYHLAVDIILKSEEDAEILRDYIENLIFSHSATSAEFDNRFWKSRTNIMGKKTLELKDGKKLRLVEFDLQGEMWIPRKTALSLTSKYSEIDVEDLSGEISLDLYNDKVYGNNLEGPLKIKVKYGKLEFKNMKDIEADFYNTNFIAEDIGNLDLSSKYSKFRAGNAGDITIEGYNDKLEFKNTGAIHWIDKYSSLLANNVANMELDCYNSSITVTGADDIQAKLKYGDYDFGDANLLRISSTYNTTFNLHSLAELDVTESKYSNYRIDELTLALSLQDGYSDKFIIKKTANNLSGIKLAGKYINAELVLDPGFDYLFKANVKYPKFDINEGAMDVVRKITEGSDFEMEAIKGTMKDGMPEFIVNGYDLKLVLK
ncbi:hypothetical protein ACFLT1_06955 [Bacteroidota bacterium]